MALAFDHLRRQQTGVAHYQPLPSVSKQIFSASFADFCQWAITQCQMTQPTPRDMEQALAQAQARMPINRRIELVRHAFRRAMELWLVLDRVLFLQEQGYQVTLSEFCPRLITPRNLLIHASR